MKEIDSENCFVLLIGNTKPSKVKLSSIKRKDDILNFKKAMENFNDKVRVDDSQIFSWKQVKELIKFAKSKTSQ